MAVSVNKNLSASYILEDPLGRIANYGRVSNLGRVGKKGYVDSRFAPNFDGVDDYGVLASRAINPDLDVFIEWQQASASSVGTREIVTQSESSTFSSREFVLRWDSGLLIITFGGTLVLTSSDAVPISSGNWLVSIVGSEVTVKKDGATVFNNPSRARGLAREPAAPTRICTRSNDGTLTGFYVGLIYNIRINGVLWAMDQRNQAIQLPEPSGLGAELITPTVLENPFSKGSQWTYLGDGRWQFVGDGSQSDLTFIGSANMPANGCLVELEVESYSGAGTARFSSNPSVVNSTFTGTGIKRAYVTSQAGFNMGRQTGVLSMIIKNISFKPLGTCNPMTLVNVTSDRWQEVVQ